jgi:hypothetical protein
VGEKEVSKVDILRETFLHILFTRIPVHVKLMSEDSKVTHTIPVTVKELEDDAKKVFTPAMKSVYGADAIAVHAPSYDVI